MALDIRTRVFVDEQGVPLDEEIDGHDRTDPDAVHALAYDAGRAIGTGRFCIAEPGTAQIGRMAVLPEARGAGAGKALLDTLVTEARRRGYARAYLLAQIHARDFYRKAGFVDDGGRIWDAGIEHQPRRLALRHLKEKTPLRPGAARCFF